VVIKIIETQNLNKKKRIWGLNIGNQFKFLQKQEVNKTHNTIPHFSSCGGKLKGKIGKPC